MKILNFGSLNLDLVYQMPHFVRAGETLSSTGFSRNVGGKGLNQSVALAKAGAEIYHAGLVGEDGEMLRDAVNDTHGVPPASGHNQVTDNRPAPHKTVVSDGVLTGLPLHFLDCGKRSFAIICSTGIPECALPIRVFEIRQINIHVSFQSA